MYELFPFVEIFPFKRSDCNFVSSISKTLNGIEAKNFKLRQLIEDDVYMYYLKKIIFIYFLQLLPFANLDFLNF